MIDIIPISAFKDNYIWVGVNHHTKSAFAIDPGDAAPLINYLTNEKITLNAILITHKHTDHTAGVDQLIEAYPSVAVYAYHEERLKHITHRLKDNDIIKLSQLSEPMRVIHIPGHTLEHVAYYSHPNLFSGDTLFSGGCGRVFEGSPEQMLSSLEALASLPDDTYLYCGHEYTLANLIFAQHVEPTNKDIQAQIIHVESIRKKGMPSLPSTIGIEKKVNPFLRCKQTTIISAVEKHVGRKLGETASVFHELRQWKNSF